MSSTFAFPRFGEKGEYDYTRSGNPNRDQLAGALAALEGGSGGVVTASGMSAVHLVTQLVKPGELIVAPHDCYGGCHRLFTAASAKGQFDLEWLPLWETEASVKQILELRPRIVWIETPSNPLLRITDIQAIADAAHEAGALVVVDNTFLSPAGQKPFSLGADIVLHSTTKYINGFDSFQTLRGLRTLSVRFQQHQRSAETIALTLEENELVRKVYYPGLASHEGHELAARQQNGFGAMISFEIEADEQEIPVFLGALNLFTLAESLGGVESLVAHPASMTHAAMPEEDQLKAGISCRLLRLSVGIEHVDDLQADLDSGFQAVLQYREQRPVRSVA
jgi:cystathionine gamma-synthase